MHQWHHQSCLLLHADPADSLLSHCMTYVRVVDYSLGHPGSVHNAHAFLGTEITNNPEGLIPPQHWVWANSAYPMQTWCIVPFKAMRLAGLSQSRNIYNKYLSKVTYHITNCITCWLMFTGGLHLGRACVCSIKGMIQVPPRALVSHANKGKHKDRNALDPMLFNPPQYDHPV